MNRPKDGAVVAARGMVAGMGGRGTAAVRLLSLSLAGLLVCWLLLLSLLGTGRGRGGGSVVMVAMAVVRGMGTGGAEI